jgi:hypothetical protein
MERQKYLGSDEFDRESHFRCVDSETFEEDPNNHRAGGIQSRGKV